MQQRVGQAVAAIYGRSQVEILLEPPRVAVAAVGPAKGPADAPVTIIEFSDFQCPYCKRALPTLSQLLEKYPEKIRVVYRHLPLEGIHPRARPAAAASVCAEDQGRFWDYHDLVFENNRALEDADLESYAGRAGLDVESFKQCIADGRHRERIDADIEAATQAGITGTPAFVVNGIVMRGAKPLDDFAVVIDAELARAAGGESPPAG
jgi:protein-disulfide isomerase